MSSSCNEESIQQLVCPMGQKAAKRKGKAVQTSYIVNLTGIEKALEKKWCNERTNTCKKVESIPKLYDILMQDTSSMNESQLKHHEHTCGVIKKQLSEM